ncbi:hypothetical protein GpartN1_g5433.t1 [Galdieria partita]|uniref:Nascent polypeptide-associated complex subunit beta n=1 Tax=Galdieria partita TaxID=83374 RepID=A0A9C7USH8_9RHOD|nr:hypothetical protein GpartN1_g5433.t1 [Galdieria partita]
MENEAQKNEKLAKLQRMAVNVRTGGKGTVRRKKKAVHKGTPTDDKRLQSTLKRLGLNQIPGIEEVNIFKDNGQVINFTTPKVQAAIGANTYVVSGQGEIKSLQELLPNVLNQLGSDNLAQMRSLMESLSTTDDKGEDATENGEKSKEDDDIPELVEAKTFDQMEESNAKDADVPVS